MCQISARLICISSLSTCRKRNVGWTVLAFDRMTLVSTDGNEIKRVPGDRQQRAQRTSRFVFARF